MKHKMFLAPCSVGLVIVFLGATLPQGYSRGGGGFHGGGSSRGGGGFSREGPAAGGSLSSRAGSMQGGQRSAQASRQQSAVSAQANRQQTAAAMQSRAQQAHASYPYNNWDAGRGLAVATGAAIGAAVANSVTASDTTPTYSSGQPCADTTVVSAGDMQYFRCGSIWYSQAYGPSGPTFVQVAAPPGY